MSLILSKDVFDLWVATSKTIQQGIKM